MVLRYIKIRRKILFQHVLQQVRVSRNFRTERHELVYPRHVSSQD